MSFPNKEDRLVCWSHRDEYWKCLDGSKSESDCNELRKQYEQFCPSQWVKHFDRKREYLKFKERLEHEGECSRDGRKWSPNKSDAPIQCVAESSIFDFPKKQKRFVK